MEKYNCENEINELFAMFGCVELARILDDVAFDLVRLSYDEVVNTDEVNVLRELRDTFNRIAVVNGEKPYVPGVKE